MVQQKINYFRKTASFTKAVLFVHSKVVLSFEKKPNTKIQIKIVYVFLFEIFLSSKCSGLCCQIPSYLFSQDIHGGMRGKTE